MELKNLVIFGLKIRLYAIEIAIMNQHADNCLSEQKKDDRDHARVPSSEGSEFGNPLNDFI